MSSRGEIIQGDILQIYRKRNKASKRHYDKAKRFLFFGGFPSLCQQLIRDLGKGSALGHPMESSKHQ